MATGVIYWAAWRILLPKVFGYELVPRKERLEDGTVITLVSRPRFLLSAQLTVDLLEVLPPESTQRLIFARSGFCLQCHYSLSTITTPCHMCVSRALDLFLDHG